MSLITFERVALVLLLATVLWQGRLVREEHKYLADMGERFITLTEAVEDLQKEVKELGEREPEIVYVPTPAAAPSGAAGPGAAAPGGAGPAAGAWSGVEGIDPAAMAAAPRRSKRQMPAVPGGQVMTRLYDAADRMAADEGWDQNTYDQVSMVFEDSATVMMDLYRGLQSGTVTQQQAREEALAVRDDATSRLSAVLGADGLDRLKGYVRGP